jgi:hypothetical protein
MDHPHRTPGRWVVPLAVLSILGGTEAAQSQAPAPTVKPKPPAAPVSASKAEEDRARVIKWLRETVQGQPTTEAAEMLLAIAKGSRMGPGGGWFHPGKCRYGWTWLARRHGVEPTGRIPRKSFQGPPELFDRLDRDHDGALTAVDFDWSERSPFLQQSTQANMLFYRLDANSNGRISRAEWEAFFRKAARGKSYLTPDDLRLAIAMPPPPKSSGPASGGPTSDLLFRGLLRGELGSFREGPDVGQEAPDFTLATHDGKAKVRLSELRGKKPVVLIFGSFT